MDLDHDLEVHSPEANRTEVIWAPDSKRFACNYAPVHAHHTRVEFVAFYQLRDGEWAALRSPSDIKTEDLQLAQLGKGHLPISAVSSDGWIAESRERNAGMDDEESDRTFHFLRLEGPIKNQKLSAKDFSRHSCVALSDERRSPAPLSLEVMAAIASPPRTLALHKPGAVLRAHR